MLRRGVIILGLNAHHSLRFANCYRFSISKLVLPPVSTVRYFSKNKKSSKSGDDKETAQVALPDIKASEGKMNTSVKWFEGELAKLKVGKASTDMFNDLKIDGYGPVSAAGQITLKSPTKITITVYDPSMTEAVSDAIKECGLGINPTVEGSVIVINVPKPSKETRDNLAKVASRVAEKTKLDLRQHRKVFLDEIKKLKGVGEDDVKSMTKEIEALTEKKVTVVSNLLKDKEKEILSG